MTGKKTAIITGSATGVGAATALGLAQRGYNVVINYSRSEAEARETEAACKAAGADTLLFRADVADDTQCRAMVQATMQRWNRLDALVNNAGVTRFSSAAQWDQITVEDFTRIMGVNVIGTFQMTRAGAPHLKASRGSVVNVSSTAGINGLGSSLPYVASKGGVNAMTHWLARNMAPEVRVNAVCPGLIDTRWFVQGVGQENYDMVKANFKKVAPLGDPSSAEDVAQAVIWLIESARTTTGELLRLDSGVHLGAVARQ